MDVLISHVFQPVIDLASRRTVHVEMLVRAVPEEHVRPDDYVQFLEVNNTIPYLDCWNVERAIGLLLSARVPRAPEIAVNISPATLSCPKAGLWIERVIRTSGVARSLHIEVTERGIISDLPQMSASIKKLRLMGVRVALDDYGAGDDREELLDAVEFDYLKMDGSITNAALAGSSDATALFEEAAYRMSLHGGFLVAEHVPSLESIGSLIELGAALGQGNSLSEPAPLRS